MYHKIKMFPYTQMQFHILQQLNDLILNLDMQKKSEIVNKGCTPVEQQHI